MDADNQNATAVADATAEELDNEFNNEDDIQSSAVGSDGDGQGSDGDGADNAGADADDKGGDDAGKDGAAADDQGADGAGSDGDGADNAGADADDKGDDDAGKDGAAADDQGADDAAPATVDYKLKPDDLAHLSSVVDADLADLEFPNPDMEEGGNLKYSDLVKRYPAMAQLSKAVLVSGLQRVLDPIMSRLEPVLSRFESEAALAGISKYVPDAANIAAAPEFTAWLGKQSKVINRLYKSSDIEDRAEVLKLFKVQSGFGKAPTAEEEAAAAEAREKIEAAKKAAKDKKDKKDKVLNGIPSVSRRPTVVSGSGTAGSQAVDEQELNDAFNEEDDE